MLYSISGKNMTVRDGVRDAIEKKLSRLDKYFSEDTEAKVVLSYTKDLQKIEVTIPTKLGLVRAEEESRDIISSIDDVADSIVAHIKKHKQKIISKRQSAVSFSRLFIEERDNEEHAVRGQAHGSRGGMPADGYAGAQLLRISGCSDELRQRGI